MKRIALGIVVIAIIGLLPVIALTVRGPDSGGTAGARPSGAGPKTPRPSIVVTPTPTAGPILTPTDQPISGPTTPPASPPTSAPDAVLVGAGDIASCASTDDEATAALVNTIPGTVYTLGDTVYDNGTTSEFDACYGPSWGQPSIKSRTRPAVGNHEYNTANATGYYAYFGAAAGDPTKGYYAYDLGAWRVYVLNSNCAAIGGCEDGSPQENWLQADLAANPRACVVAMWHHALFSSGVRGSSTATQALWQTLYDFNAELVLVGHEHHYERFAPQSATGQADDARGIVEIVAGTGGRSHYATGTPRANSLVRNSDTYGVLQLVLSATSWTSTFVPVAGSTFTDIGSGTCR